MSNLTLKKIDGTTDVQHLLACIFAGAKRVGMQPQVTDQTLGKQDQQNKGKENKMIVSRMDKQILPANLHPAVCVSKMSQLMGRANPVKEKAKAKAMLVQTRLATIMICKAGKGNGKQDSTLKPRPPTAMKLVPEGWSLFHSRTSKAALELCVC